MLTYFQQLESNWFWNDQFWNKLLADLILKTSWLLRAWLWQWEGHLLKPLLCCEEAACPIISNGSLKIPFRLTLPPPRLLFGEKNNRTHWIGSGSCWASLQLFAQIYFSKFIFQKLPLANAKVAASLKSNLVQFSCLISPAGQSHAGASAAKFISTRNVFG